MLIVTELYNLKGTALAGLHNPQVPLHACFYQNSEFFKLGKTQIPMYSQIQICVYQVHTF